MMLKKCLLTAVCCASGAAIVGCSTCGSPDYATRPPSPTLKPARVGYRLGVARYTLCRQPLDRALAMLQDMDCHYMGLKEGTLAYDASDAEIAAYKAKCAAYGVEVVSAGPLYYETAEELEACCRFAKRYGMKYISVVPYMRNPKIARCTTDEERKAILPDWREWNLESDRMLDVLDACVKKYDLRAAIHNHGPDNKYLFPTAESALKRIGSRDRRIGVCLDVGHERRAGLDPAAFIRRYGDRVFEVHLKNIKIDPVENLAKEGPRGELDVPAILGALADTGYTGYCLVEFEKDFDRNAVPLAESFGYYRGVIDAMPLGKEAAK